MKAAWEVWISRPDGTHLKLVDKLSAFQVSKSVNSPAPFTLWCDPMYFNYIDLDSIIEFWRTPEGGENRLFSLGFIRGGTLSDDSDGKRTFEVRGFDPLFLLGNPGGSAGRIVAYAAGSAQAEKTDYADDMIKAVIRENLGSSATDADRILSQITVAADESAGVSITRSFSRRNVLTVCQELAEASRAAGTAVFFDFFPTWKSTGLSLNFRTHTTQLGRDRTVSGGYPVFFGLEQGNLDNPMYEYDLTDEISVVYAGGQGEEENREVVEVEATDQTGLSIWNRREAFKDARNEGSTAGITAQAYAELVEARPRLKFSGALRDSDMYRYGIDWEYGDRVTCSYAGIQFDGMIKSITIGVNETGAENIDARVEVDL